MFPGALEAFINLAPSPHWNRRISDPAYFRGKIIFTVFSSSFLMILYIVVVPSLSYCTSPLFCHHKSWTYGRFFQPRNVPDSNPGLCIASCNSLSAYRYTYKSLKKKLEGLYCIEVFRWQNSSDTDEKKQRRQTEIIFC